MEKVTVRFAVEFGFEFEFENEAQSHSPNLRIPGYEE
jgi:hypothetical protein